jgi:hypothetical protein
VHAVDGDRWVAAGVRRRSWRVGTEIAKEGLERGGDRDVDVRSLHRAVVIAGDRENRPIVTAVRLVELVVVVLALAEVVDDVPQVEEKGWDRGAAGFHVVGHRVRHAMLALDEVRRRSALVSDHMKGDRPGVQDRLQELGSEDLTQAQMGRARERLDLALMPDVVVLLVQVRLVKGNLVGSSLGIGKHADRIREPVWSHRVVLHVAYQVGDVGPATARPLVRLLRHAYSSSGDEPTSPSD